MASATAIVMLTGVMTCQAQDLVVNGYTYFAPSVYPAPPKTASLPIF